MGVSVPEARCGYHRPVRTLVAALLAASLATAHEPGSTGVTWGREISRIVFRRCAGCHAEGSPNGALVRYAQVRARLEAVRRSVLDRSMPPWGAVRGFGLVSPDESLTGEEIRLIADWIEGGAPEGDPRLTPPVPGPAPAAPPLPGRRIPLPQKILAPLTVTALAPSTDVADARVTAHLPGGQVVPLLRLLGYRAAWQRVFRFSEPVRLPRGTTVRVDPPAAIDAFIAAPRP